MGAGKSTVGRRLAKRIGLPFADADEEIEAAAGLTVAEIFERYGEAHFRDGERRVLARLIEGPPRVIATGGGAFMDDETRALILARCTAIWLDAEVETLAERVGRRDHRPLLKGTGPARPAPAARRDPQPGLRRGASHHPRRRAAAREDGRPHRRGAGGAMIRIGEGLIGTRRAARRASCSWSPTRTSRRPAGRRGSAPTSPAASCCRRARASKSLGDGRGAARRAARRAGIGRADHVVAVGGGVVGDVAGFAAAILKRGCDWIAVPTTLLAQADAAIGGKTAINARQPARI